MKKLYTTLMLFALMTCSITSDCQKIEWQNDSKLTWSLFEANAPSRSQFHALTQSGVFYNYSAMISGDDISLDVTIYSYFDPQKSWVVDGKQTPELLAHEQLHFDISEIHARLLRKSISEATLTDDYKQEIMDIFTRNVESRREMQDLYDLETDHMKNPEAQKRWSEYIHDRIDELKEFTGNVTARVSK